MTSPTIETSIWLALRARVQSLVLSPALPVAWPNEAFTPPAGAYLRVAHLPNRTDRLLINRGLSRYQGILQIAHMAPLNQAPNVPGAVIEQVGQIAAHFPADLRLAYADASIRITKKPDVAQGFRDDASTRWMTPVSISYECFA